MQRRTGLVTEGGEPVTLIGTPIATGDRAPDFHCLHWDGETLSDVRLADTGARLRLFSVVPSVDTPVCAIQTRRFADELAAEAERLAVYTVSVDTPWALHRFADEACLAAGTLLSDYRPVRSFGHAFGVLEEETGDLARSLFLVDADGTVVYHEIAPEGFEHVDYDAALGAIRERLGGAGLRSGG